MTLDSTRRLPSVYLANVRSRSTLRFLLGLMSRARIYCKYSIIRSIARFNGAKIGANTIIPIRLAWHANNNLEIGDDVICETSLLDLRSKIVINDNCIINKQVQILRVSHYIDDNVCFQTRHYEPLVIESYCWICTGSHILPSCTNIAEGTVVSAFSTVTKNTSKMDVIGTDGKVLRKHNTTFTDLIIPSLKGGDLLYYLYARKTK